MEQAPTHQVISFGGYHAAAITNEGKVICWGDNYRRQCDVPAELDSEVVVSVSCGGHHTAVLTAAGNVVLRGWNNCGQLDVPAELAASGRVSAISCGYDHTCVVTQAGEVACWGCDGRDVAMDECSLPTGLKSVVSLFVGGCSGHSAAVTSKGCVSCWGTNDYGQCDVARSFPTVTSVACGQWPRICNLLWI
jgi:alpha-tubulin suppressor-like RCC1 family protein